MPVKNPEKTRSFFPGQPKAQAGNAEIDLINERQILVAFGILDFVDSDSIDLVEHPGAPARR